MPTAKALLKEFNDIKTLPHVAIRLTEMIAEDQSTMKDFEDVIKMDPTLVLRLLRLVNSPYYALRKRIESIAEALVFVGMKTLRNMVVVEALKGVFKTSPNEEYFSRPQLWIHCAAVSICSQMIAERIFGKKGEDAFLCGILHDIGIIVEDQVASDLFIEACKTYDKETQLFTKHENEIIGTNHCAIGNLLSQDWKFSTEVCDGIRHHHSDMKKIEPSSLTGIIQVSEYMMSRLNYAANPPMKVVLSPPLMVHIRDNIEEYRAITNDFPAEMSKAKDLYDLSGD